ncbi:MAG: FtsX-like permease family protein [Pirellulales bacterium]
MEWMIDLGEAGLTSIVRHPLRSAVVSVCIALTIVPFLVLTAISAAVRHDALLSIEEGADLYVTATEFGEATALPLAAAETVRAWDGVERVTPRVTGRVWLGREKLDVVVVGLPAADRPALAHGLRGRWFSDGPTPELVLGSQLAGRLKLKPGDYVPPFYTSRRGDRVARVVGVFESEVSVWESNLMLTSLEHASDIFDEPGKATELLVWCRPGYESAVRDQVLRGAQSWRPQATTKAELLASVPSGLAFRDGVLAWMYLTAFVCAMLVVAVASGIGLSERRREIGILKALGWQTDALLLRSFVESLALSSLGTSLAVVAAHAWLRYGHGVGARNVLLPGADPDAAVPYRMFVEPTLLAAGVALVVVLTGSLWSTWRAAMAPPSDAMRG